MKTALPEKMPQSSGRLYALSPDYRPELAKGHVLFDQSLPVEERIEMAQAESIAKLVALRPQAEGGDTRSQTEFAKEAKLLQWLCGEGAKGWVEENHPWRDAIFFAKYQFQVLVDGFVRFTLPKGVSYLELFDDVNRYCQENGRGRVAVCEGALERFAERADATKKSGHSQTQEVQGFVPGSTDKTRAEQKEYLKSRGLSWASLEAVTAAAALYFCNTGEDLLKSIKDNWIRTAAPALGLCFSAYGLGVFAHGYDNFCLDGVGAAGARNLET